MLATMTLGRGGLRLLGTFLVLINGPLDVPHGAFLSWASPSHGSGSNNGIGGGNVQGPQLTSELPSRLLFSNSSGGSLPCSATGQPAPTIRWLTEDGEEAADVPRLRHVRQGDGSLVFLPFRADQFRRDVHEARYRCSASNAIGTVVSPQVHVTAVLDTNYDMRFSDKHVVAGNPVLLQCPIPSHLGDHVFVTSWQRVDGYVITRNTHGDDYVVTADGQLYIREVRDAEELLRYRCHTENTLTRRKKTSSNFVRLLLREPVTMQMPSIVFRSSRVQSDPGHPVDLLCVAEGFPIPSYSWYKRDGQRMLPLEPSMDLRQVAGVLRFREVEASDAGTYVCLATNSVGEAQVDLELVITPKPWVVVSPAHVRAEVGHAAAFRCNASGLDWGVLDETSLEWRHNGRRLMPSTQQVSGMGRSRVLHLPSIRRQDQGMYQCFVRLSPKRTVQSAAELIVGDQAPKLKSTFEETTVRPGKPVSLRCVASGDPPPRITWLLDGVWPIDSRHGRVRVRTTGAEAGSGLGGAEVSSTLTISSAEVQDGGSYSCEASNYAGVASHSARINVYGSIYVRALGNLSALAAATFSVQCPFGGYPFGHVYWEKDGRRLPLNQRQTVFPNGTLQIQATDREHDQGQYTCTVHGPDAQIIHRTISLHVRSGPQITPFAFQSNLHEGVRASLTCLVHAGDPPIRLEWLRDGKPLVPGAHPDVSIMTDEGGFVSTLTLKRLSSRQNGNYTCRATNQYASAEHSAELLVKVPPTWTMEPNDTIAVSGRSVYVDCQASGVPQPHIRWKSAAEPDGPASQFRTIISNSHIHILVNGTLSIRSVEPGDAGLYLCEASNGVGSGISRVLQLTVRSAPRFASKFTTVSVRRGESTEVTCPAQGDSPIRFHWLKNNLPLNVLKDHRYSRVEDRSGDVTTSKITVQHAERSDNGVFTCQAANEFGEDSTSVQLTVQDVPDPPSDVDVREVGSRTARVTWSVPFTGNSPITQYVLHWKTADGLWQDTLTVSGLETKATVRGLLPTTTYHLRVRADNILGISDYSTPVEFTTSKEPPRFPPKNVQASATNTRTISVSFDNPRHTKADDQVEGFYVGYRELSSLDAFTFKTFDASPALISAPTSHDHASGPSEHGVAGAAAEPQPHRLSYELTGLRRSTEYAVTVQSFNAKGAGPQSEVVRVRTLDFDPPSAPNLRIGGTTARSISVNWENEHHQEAPITGFSLYYKVEGSAGVEWHEVSVPHDRRAFTLTDLRCGTEYLVYIRAANRAGKGPQGETLSVRTNGGRPVEPDPSRLFEINSTFVVLHLDAWESGGCPVSYFVVQYRPEARVASPSSTSSEWTLHSNNVVPQQQLVQLADLAPGSWYTLLMSAHNDAGSTEVELSFATLTLTGELPSRSYELLDPQVTFYRHLTVTVPIVSAIVVLVIVVGVVCVILRRRNYDPRQRIGDGMVVAECCDASKGDLMLAVSHESQAREPVYYPAPYATHNRSGTAAGPGSGQCNNVAGARESSTVDDPKNRTYDVPYPVKRLEMWEPSPEELVTCMEVYEKAGQETIYRSSPYHISKPKPRRTRWRDDGDRSSGSENDAEDLLDEERGGTIPQSLIVPLDKFSSWDLDATAEDSIHAWKNYPSAYETASVRCAGEYTSIT